MSATEPVAEAISRRSSARRAAREREESVDAAFVAQWVASLALASANSTGPTAAARFEALRGRVRAKGC